MSILETLGAGHEQVITCQDTAAAYRATIAISQHHTLRLEDRDFSKYANDDCAILAADGANPTAGLIWDAKGNLYGSTFSGGTYDAGTVFKLSR